MSEPNILDEISSIVGKKNIAMPTIEEQGKGLRNPNGVSNPRIDPAVMSFIMQASIASQAVRIRKLLEKASFQGKLDVREFIATDVTQTFSPLDEWPNVPWISAFLINDGPNTGYIRINRASGWIILNNGETRTVDHSHADEKIGAIYYRCNEGETAQLRVEAYY